VSCSLLVTDGIDAYSFFSLTPCVCSRSHMDLNGARATLHFRPELFHSSNNPPLKVRTESRTDIKSPSGSTLDGGCCSRRSLRQVPHDPSVLELCAAFSCTGPLIPKRCPSSFFFLRAPILVPGRARPLLFDPSPRTSNFGPRSGVFFAKNRGDGRLSVYSSFA